MRNWLLGITPTSMVDSTLGTIRSESPDRSRKPPLGARQAQFELADAASKARDKKMAAILPIAVAAVQKSMPY